MPTKDQKETMEDSGVTVMTFSGIPLDVAERARDVSERTGVALNVIAREGIARECERLERIFKQG